MSQEKATPLIKLESTDSLEAYKIRLHFSDGRAGIIDFSNKVGKGVFKAWEDEKFFNNYSISDDKRSLIWGEEIDICVDSLYKQISE